MLESTSSLAHHHDLKKDEQIKENKSLWIIVALQRPRHLWAEWDGSEYQLKDRRKLKQLKPPVDSKKGGSWVKNRRNTYCMTKTGNIWGRKEGSLGEEGGSAQCILSRPCQSQPVMSAVDSILAEDVTHFPTDSVPLFFFLYNSFFCPSQTNFSATDISHTR